ncbi:MAG: endonuclease [Fibrobacterota bacterium]
MYQLLYRCLDRHFGNLHWWPGQTPFEVIAGAILTQNTTWTNVEKALKQLRSKKGLTLRGMRRLPEKELAQLIHSSGYYNQKARKLKAFLGYLNETFGGRLSKMQATETATLRQGLLSVRGIGPETADSILLYAFGKPVFVVDSYTRRLFERLGILRGGEGYDTIRFQVEADAEKIKPNRRAAYYNQFHALIVNLCKDFCRKSHPLCSHCPVKSLNCCKYSL